MLATIYTNGFYQQLTVLRFQNTEIENIYLDIHTLHFSPVGTQSTYNIVGLSFVLSSKQEPYKVGSAETEWLAQTITQLASLAK